MKKIAICYWGLTRSTKKVYQSHHDKLFKILNDNNYEYDIFMHTWITDENLIWENKCEIPIDYEEYKLLTPKYYKLENQTEYLDTIHFSDYFNEELYDRYGGDTPNEWRPKLIRNHLCALESQKRVTNMVSESEKSYDYVIYIRPDVMLLTQFNINFLDLNPNCIAIPNNEHHEGYNDRFAIVNYEDCRKYGCRIDEIIEFRKHHGRIVSEKYVKFIINKYFKDIRFIHFQFNIIRP